MPKIVYSPLASLLTLVVGPSQEGREVGKKKKELAEQDTIMLRFWTKLLERLQQKTSLHADLPPKPSNWLIDSAGVSGLSYGCVVRKNDARVEL